MKNIFRNLIKGANELLIFIAILLLFALDSGFSQSNLITNGGFEDGTTGWTVWNASLSISSDAHTGNSAALISNRQNSWDALVRDISALLVNGKMYTLTAWVKILTRQ